MPPVRPPESGSFTPYVIGEAGRADRIISVLDDDRPHVHDTLVDGVSIKDGAGEVRLVVRAASVRGRAHRHKGIVRQDDYALSVSTDRRWALAAVADGVSRSPRSHIAADRATRAGVEMLRSHLHHAPLDELDWGALFHAVARDIRAVMIDREPSLDGQSSMEAVAAHTAATVVFGVVAVDPDPTGAHPATVVRVGDTSGWILHTDRRWEAIGAVKNEGASIAESATAALPIVPDEPPVVAVTAVPAGAALVLMTDGVGDALANGHGEVGATLATLWAAPPPPLAFAAQVDFARRTFDDDRTAVAIWTGAG